MIDRLVIDLAKLQTEPVEKTWYYKTRAPRPGEIIHRLSKKDFDEKLAKGEIIFPGENAGDKVGYPAEILQKEKGIVIFNIMAEGAKKLKDFIESKGGKALLVYLDAPRKQRIQRVMIREQWVKYELAEHKVANDIANREKDVLGFDLVVENKDGDFEKNYNIILNKVKEFLNNEK